LLKLNAISITLRTGNSKERPAGKEREDNDQQRGKTTYEERKMYGEFM
jgi:hypothetical protein